MERIIAKGSLFCWDMTQIDKDKMRLYGGERTDNMRIQAFLAPCNYKFLETDPVHPECEAELSKQHEYLGNIDIIIMYN